ncbi:nucleoside 2-deoxyribosyltransferase [Sinorhizobium meliloti]|uniref:nucleoside 2-deoxyribosyltransferase n=1 Tax=Rhizobium meliloti TaxID=382 RepID=UPI0001E4AB5C|nr:nucleoside 2-deoxyribosyltransferase [Sinorhizobium meliloti]AEG53145.1 nucleoside 2-deoxyribosyltransferase [Sinorhizobium meliloti AK83]MDE4591140.1 nucleoside 2-deoxyribosyltransferase [Sinorhizobium meliloti]SEI56041.1 Nucleoside 2-deoxyribosyltransferase [Sinorhizobium meliloti]
MTRLRIYTASKLRHAEWWRQLRQEWPEFDWVSRWPVEHCGNIPDSDTFARWFWMQDIEDVSRCDVCVVFADGNDHLRGALVEAGAAIALHKTVIVVGAHEDYGTWQWHSSVRRVKDFDELRVTLNLLAKHGVRGFAA